MPEITNHIFEQNNYIDLTLYQYGMEECAPMHLFGPAKRNHYLLHFVLKGKGTFQFDEYQYNISAGQAFLISPGLATLYYADAIDPWTYIWIEFDGLKAKEFLKDAGLTERTPIYQTVKQSDPGSLVNALLDIVEHPRETPLYTIGHLYLFFDLLIKQSAHQKIQKTGNIQEFYVREGLNYIEQNYFKNITVEDIADHCNIHRSHFGKLFKKTFSVTPQEFLLQYRMNKACDLLSKTESPIGDIALSVGYPNQLHFSRAFKNKIGMSPRAYRTTHKVFPS